MSLDQTQSAAASHVSRFSVRALTFDQLALVVLLLFLLAKGLTMPPQSDTWWQLRSGQWIVEHGTIPLHDPFSSTVAGAPWPNHEWLAEVVFYGAYVFGGLPALTLVCTLVLAATWLLIYQLCEGPARVRVIALLLCMLPQYIVWSVRAHLFSLFLTALCVWMLPRRRLHWLYPLVFLLWANIHAGVAFGAVILLAGFGAAAITNRADLPRWIAIGLLCALATLVNPMGIGLWSYVLSAFHDNVRTLIEEWRPPSLGWPVSYPFFLVAALWCVVVLACRRTWRSERDWALLLVGLAFLVLGSRSIRHTASFALVAAPLLTRPLRDWKALAAGPARAVQFRLVLLAAIVVATAFSVVRDWNSAERQPPLSARIIAGIQSCPGTLFNSYEDGGALLWFVPERPVFVDSRQDPYSPELLLASRNASQTGEYKTLFQRYTIGCALTPATGELHNALVRDGWHPIVSDPQHAVFHAPLE